MLIEVKYSNSVKLIEGKISSGFIKWSIYCNSPHYKNVEIIENEPLAEFRVEGDEKNTFLYFKLPKMLKNDEIFFSVVLLFNTKNLRVPLIDFSFKEYPLSIIGKYCHSSKYWNIHNPKIKEIVNNLKNKTGDNVKLYLKEAFNFVNNYIKFKKRMNERIGIEKILENKIGDCDEFSDLFITLLRAAKIPSIRSVGILASENNTKVPNYNNKINNHNLYISKDIKSNTNFNEFHAWSEVFIPHYNTFVPFDPTLKLFSGISEKHILRIRMRYSDNPSFLFIKCKGTQNIKINSLKNDLSYLKILEE